MSILLHIDTAVQTASVCLAENGNPIGLAQNPSQRDHAAWLQAAIADLLRQNGLSLKQLGAVAVSAGPGSYTGLRVGMATAKGLCYALDLPLITINTLKMMAVAALDAEADLLCPLIDARRMEVFTAVFDKELNEIIAPYNCILTDSSYKELLDKQSIAFFGNGSNKLKELIKHSNAAFKEVNASAEHMTFLSYRDFQEKKFADLAYCEPFYGKDFFSPTFKVPERQ
ncbi:tRNA (adenosine(37)-N6)-threonylcarbamoyltransferase complex dimerization subunit type 1 TsaB [Paraflavisolibacter sp. H34]|uniref:tRNA (adenosine(37)-N6)-threonylcarbamoyltransferase complex dimerization subunit type 1 TsaB n=1 Tax=Huijunlia imazamoxiresistens TaxID=3127457 RepID=UPI0030170EB9